MADFPLQVAKLDATGLLVAIMDVPVEQWVTDTNAMTVALAVGHDMAGRLRTVKWEWGNARFMPVRGSMTEQVARENPGLLGALITAVQQLSQQTNSSLPPDVQRAIQNYQTFGKVE